MKQAAEAALKQIGKKDITEIKTVQKPHEHVIMVMSAVCVLLDVEPLKEMNPQTQKKEINYWKPTQKLMNGATFLQDLLGYDSESVSEKHIKGLQQFTEKEQFNKDYLLKINMVAANLAGWVLAMQNLYKVNLVVRPLKASLEEAMQKYNVVSAELKIKQAELKEVMDKVNGLKR
jgi:hypothetical protein